MNSVVHKYLDKFVLVFINDILVYSVNEEECREHLRLVLQILREHNLYAKFSKCDFYRGRTQYLGHVISKDGLYVNREKFRTILNWPIPEDVLVVHSFMGIIGYYQIFIE